MASKYDAFWLERKNAIAVLIEEAVTNGKSEKFDVSAIKELGDRASWYGYVYSRHNFAFKSEMAHADALRNMLNNYQMLASLHCDLKMTLSEDATLIVKQTKYKLDWHDFELASVFTTPFGIVTEYNRNDRVVQFDWFAKYYKQTGFFNPGLKFIAYMIYLFCIDDNRFSPALMEKSKWFRLAKDGLDIICVPLQIRQLKVHLRTTRNLPGWSIYKSDPTNFVERSVKDDNEIEAMITTTIKFLNQDITLLSKSNMELIHGEVNGHGMAIEPKGSIPSRSSLLTAQKVLFCNIGWMKYYQGIPPDGSDRIEGGGKYVDEHGYGFEILNFRPFGGKLYGYVRPVAKDDFEEGTIRIERLGVSVNDDAVDGVTVVFVSKSPRSKQRRIVGWYRNATVYRKRQIPPKGSDRIYKGKELGYYATTTDGNQYLLSELTRDQIGIKIPTGKGGMGRSNVWFAADQSEQQLVEKVLSFIGSAANVDDTDEIQFQAQVQTAEARDLPSGPIQKPSSNKVSGRVWKRDPSIAKNALVKAGYSCMLDPNHKTFTSRATGEKYVEAHHLVPMGLQDKFDVSLDAPGNVVALCPNCHRLLHQGAQSETGEPISILFKKREAALVEHGIVISLEEFLKLY